MRKILDGALYSIGAMTVSTLWYLAAMKVVDIRTDIENQEAESRSRALLEYGPGANE